jgi:mono/diheme cytochrome c family protein
MHPTQRAMALSLGCVFILAGCSDDAPTEPSSSTTSYYADVKPIIDRSCVGCHQAGQIGVGLLDSYAEVAQRAPAIREQVVDRVMPPWHADSDCNDYQGDRSLSQDEIDLVAAWIDAGAPAGDPADDANAAIAELPSLPRVDATLELPVAYTPSTKAGDDYRCFVVDFPAATTKFVTGVHVQPGNATSVHHVIAFYAGADQAAEIDALDAADPAPGYECFGGAGTNNLAGMLAGWAPGAGASETPPGTGILVEGGSKVIIQMHYNTVTWDGAPDATRIELMLEDSVDRVGWFQFFTNPQWVLAKAMPIPAGEPDVMHEFTAPGIAQFITNGEPFDVYAATFHMHTRGTSGRLSVKHADGEESCLLDIPRWDFNWQGGYNLTEPVRVTAADALYIQCHWDNSLENQPVVNGMQMPPNELNWGEGTGDEMCLGGVFVSP